jgi:hypothetical protein
MLQELVKNDNNQPTAVCRVYVVAAGEGGGDEDGVMGIRQ